MKNMYLLGVLLLLFCSCSSADKTLSEKAEKTITMLENLQKKNQISDVTFQKARENIMQYDHKGFFGKYWFWGVFIAYLIITLVVTYVESEENLDRAKPLSKWKVYLVWLCSGLWGGHIFFLWNEHKNWFASILKWFSFITVLLVFVFNYTAIMYFYDTPSLFAFYVKTWSWSIPNSYLLHYSVRVVYYLFYMNIIGGLIYIPYWTYVYNACYFRQHYENNEILTQV